MIKTMRIIAALAVLEACSVHGLSHYIPEMRFYNSSITCSSTSHLPLATRWLKDGWVYNRTLKGDIPSTRGRLNLRGGELLQCALETDKGITKWSRVMKLHDGPYPLLAAKKEQVIKVLPNEKFAHFSCNIQIREEDLHNIGRFEFIQADSCERSTSPRFYKQLEPHNWSENGTVHIPGKVDIFVREMFKIKLNYTALHSTNDTIYIQCAITLRNTDRVTTCHKIQITKNAPSCSNQQKSDFFFYVNFKEDICEDYKEGEALRHLLKRDDCLKEVGFNLQVTCTNRTTAHFRVRSLATVTVAMLDKLLDEVASVTDAPSMSPTNSTTTPTSDEQTVSSSHKPSTFPPSSIALSSSGGFLLLLLFCSILLNVALCCKRKQIYPKEEALPTTPTMSRQASTDDSSSSIIINNMGQSMEPPANNQTLQPIQVMIEPGPSMTEILDLQRTQNIAIPGPPRTDTSGTIMTHPHQASFESDDKSARVTTAPRVLPRRQSPGNIMARSADGSPSQANHQQGMAVMQSFTQHNGGTPDVSINMPGEVFNIPGAVGISTSTAGDEMEYSHPEESSTTGHQQAATGLNMIPAAPKSQQQQQQHGRPIQMEYRGSNVWSAANCIPMPAPASRNGWACLPAFVMVQTDPSSTTPEPV